MLWKQGRGETCPRMYARMRVKIISTDQVIFSKKSLQTTENMRTISYIQLGAFIDDFAY